MNTYQTTALVNALAVVNSEWPMQNLAQTANEQCDLYAVPQGAGEPQTQVPTGNTANAAAAIWAAGLQAIATAAGVELSAWQAGTLDATQINAVWAQLN